MTDQNDEYQAESKDGQITDGSVVAAVVVVAVHSYSVSNVQQRSRRLFGQWLGGLVLYRTRLLRIGMIRDDCHCCCCCSTVVGMVSCYCCDL